MREFKIEAGGIMSIKRVILASVLVSMVFVDFTTAVAQSRDGSIGQVNKANFFKTLKNDMKCLFSRTKKCTPEQRRRIAVQAGVVIAAIAAITTGSVFWVRRRRAEAFKAAQDKIFGHVQAGYKDELKKIITDYPELKQQALLDSTLSNRLELVKMLIEEGADTNEAFGGWMPLMGAINKGNYRVVEHLLKEGADADKKDPLFGVPLMYAFEEYKRADSSCHKRWSYERIIKALLEKKAKVVGFRGSWKKSLPSDDPVRKLLEKRAAELVESEE